jgi:hypothetical protein
MVGTRNFFMQDGLLPFALQINSISVIIRNIFFVSLKFFGLKLIIYNRINYKLYKCAVS